MMDGGIPVGESVLLVGPSGSGKSLFVRHFIAAGAAKGERGIIAVFEEHPGDYLARAQAFGPELAGFIERGLVEILYLHPLDLTVDETLAAIRDAVERTGAKRVAIDSLSGFELALAPSYRDDIRESISRTVTALTGLGVTMLLTMDMVQSFTELSLSPHLTEFLADVLLLQRYVEVEGKLEKMLAVVKMRSSRHATDIRRYTIDGSGVVVAEAEQRYHGMFTGVPIILAEGAESLPGLTADEAAVMRALRDVGETATAKLSRRTGLRGAKLSRALARLQELDYARKRRRDGTLLYRVNR
jgi:circadian clock protein KaiC